MTNQPPMIYLTDERDALLYLAWLADEHGAIPMSCISFSSSTVDVQTFQRFERDGLFSREEGCFRFTALGMAVVRQFTAERELQKATDAKLAEQQAREEARYQQERKERRRADRWNLAIAILSLLITALVSRQELLAPFRGV